MKKTFKLFLGLFLVLCLALSITAAAAIPTSTDTGSITVKNIKSGDTVSIYQYLEAVYNLNSNLWEGYQVVSAGPVISGYAITGSDEYEMDGATEKDIDKIVEWADGKTATANQESTGSDITFENLKLGSYLVLVTAANGSMTVYNPMIASIYYAAGDEGTAITPGAVDATGHMDSTIIKNAVEYAKSTELTFNKVANAISNAGGGEGQNDADAAVGDVVTYKITSTIPSYSKDEYDTLVYTFTDTMSKGLSYVANSMVVKLNETEVPATVTEGDTTIENWKVTEVVNETTKETTLTISFQDRYLKSVSELYNRNRDIEITYDATITKDAITKAEGAEIATNDVDTVVNKVKLTYTRNPNEPKETEEKEVKTYTYNINDEITKVDQKNAALAGAKFALYKDNTCTELYKEVTTVNEADKAYIHFEGLDEGIYYLKETAAPSGYQINTNVYTVVITGNNNADGVAQGASRTVKISSSGGDKVNADEVAIKNTKLSALPSTGGMGTYLFTILGVAIMAIMAFFFLKGRKAEEE